MIAFFIDGEPPTVTAQQKGVTTRGFKLSRKGKMRPVIAHYKKPEVEALEMKMVGWFQPHAPAQRMDGPVRLEVTFIHDWTVALKKKRAAGKLPEFVGKDTRPDTDNMLKLVKDVLTACRFWHDDGQVCAEVTRKGWGDRPGLHVVIQPYTPDYTIPVEEAVI